VGVQVKVCVVSLKLAPGGISGAGYNSVSSSASVALIANVSNSVFITDLSPISSSTGAWLPVVAVVPEITLDNGEVVLPVSLLVLIAK